MPTPMAKRLNWQSTSSPTSACNTRNTKAAGTLTCPDGIGRDRVRSTRASMSRSTRSFQVQPAPRMTMAPISNSTICQGSGPRLRRRPQPAPTTTSMAAAEATSRSGGRDASAGDKAAPIPARWCRPNFRSHQRRVRMTAHFCRALPVKVSKVPRLGSLAVWSSAMIGPPSASLSVGPAGPATGPVCKHCCECGSCWRGSS